MSHTTQSTVCAHFAREAPGEAYDKHKIKRVDRLLGNSNFTVSKLFAALLCSLRLERYLHVLLAVDWTTVGRFEVLVTSIVFDGRTLPFHWTVIDLAKERRMTAQQHHMRGLKDLLGGLFGRFTVLFDAGFDDCAFLAEAAVCLGFRVVIRSSPTSCFRSNGSDEWLKFNAMEFERGRCHDLGWGEYTKSNAIQIRCIVIHDHGQKKPWILLTNLEHDAQYIVTSYGRRFSIEETFKDVKAVRDGMQLKGCRVKSAERLSRVIALDVLAYWIMTGIGRQGEKSGHHRKMQANTAKKRVLATWRIGRDLIRRNLCPVGNLLDFLFEALSFLALVLKGEDTPCTT